MLKRHGRKIKSSMKNPSKMASVSSNSSPQSFNSSNRTPAEVSARKTRSSKDENFPEVPKVIEDSNGKRYFRGRLLGKGGFARVFEVTDMSNNKEFALKVVPKERLTKSPGKVNKIQLEIDLHKTLRHRYIVGFHGSFQDQSHFYILMELCNRKSLVQMLKSRGRLTEPEVRFFMHQAVQACAYLHEQRVIHRDIKVGNFFLKNDMELRLGDFGLAARLQPDQKQIRTMCGTPNYIAPEVLSKTGHNWQVDTWALGCVMYTLLVGHPPFETKSLRETYQRIRNNEYTIPSRISSNAAKLIQRFLQPNPSDRPDLKYIFYDDFFQCGILPRTLPLTSLTGSPKITEYERRTPTDWKKDSLNGLAKVFDRQMKIEMDEKEAIEERGVNVNRNSLDKLGNGQSGKLKNGTRSKDSDDSDRGIESDSEIQKYFSPEGLFVQLSTCLQSLNNEFRENSRSPLPELKGTSKPLFSRFKSKRENSKSKNSTMDDFSKVFIVKWVDYSNKYGFGAQMSDGSVSVRFNDCTKIALSVDKRSICYCDEDSKIARFSSSYIPDSIETKVTLLTYFSNYMDKHLLKGGDQRGCISSNQQISSPFIDIWFRTDITMVMYLSNGTLQVNFFNDHTKVVLIPGEDEAMLIYVNEQRECTTQLLSDVSSDTCSMKILERLSYCKNVLRKIMEVIAEEESKKE
ncbi:serine/threonine-protein kinase PLK1-like [Actinia tenebrosa]|uniref:Serine/threonine-protein kinase PLK n=1 Tax=Actinia tenebrosa TaxID=6105 RepID=A0A6P8I4S7_ACTTE|nr:serine/threonine-protein kinase PLK1-like [Actinia tenebrosa]